MEQSQAILIVTKELESVRERFPKFNNSHEGYAVLLEEVDELWDEVKNNNPRLASSEAVQVAAMALRFLIDVCE